MPSPGTTTFLKRTLNSSNATYSTTYFGHGGSVHVERANERLVDHGGARLASTPHHLSGHGRPEATSHLLSKNSPQPSMDEAKSQKKNASTCRVMDRGRLGRARLAPPNRYLFRLRHLALDLQTRSQCWLLTRVRTSRWSFSDDLALVSTWHTICSS